jgi:hypothetical protein
MTSKRLIVHLFLLIVLKTYADDTLSPSADEIKQIKKYK